MGLTERHWFENEEPELTERQLEDIIYEKDEAYKSGYIKGYHDRDTKIVRCKDCKHYHKGFNCDLLQKPIMTGDDWFCADGERRTDDD